MSARTLGGAACCAFACLVGSHAHGQVVFQAANDNGFFTPFSSANADFLVYGDSGWFGSGSDAPVALGRVTLGLAVYDSEISGTTDIVFTFTDGDPSQLVFGSGDVLYTTTIHDVKLPATGAGGVQYFDLVVEMPAIMTTGGFQNVGWSVGLQGFDYPGFLGFQVSSCAAQLAGFYTNNASFFDGRQWGLFSFGGGCSGVANYVATIELAEVNPCPSDLDSSGTVDAADLALLLGAWAGTGPADLDGSGSVDAADLAIMLGAWGACP